MVQVLHVSARLQRVEVEQIWTMRVNERIEAETGAPRRRKVDDVDVRVAVSLSLAPQQQSIFG